MRLYDGVDFYPILLPAKDFVRYRDAGRSFTRDALSEEDYARIVEEAEKALTGEIPLLRATVYMRFLRDGDRSEYETAYFKRRTMLRALTFAEKLGGNGRYLDRIIDLLWLICEETTWVLPAHNQRDAPDAERRVLTEDVEGETRKIDLFSAETAAELANVCDMIGDELRGEYDMVLRRVLYSIDQKVLIPFEKYLFGWEGYTKNAFLNNWNPWIISNVLTAAAFTVTDDYRREAIVVKAVQVLEKFTNTYPLDGGCDEGPSYWSVAGASLFDCLELLYDLTGGRADVFSSELVGNMCDYFRKAFISGNYVMNFADAPAVYDAEGSARLLWRMARRTGNRDLGDFARYLAWRSGAVKPLAPGQNCVYRKVENYLERVPPYEGGGVVTHASFPGITVAVMRDGESFDKGFFFAIKGGHNGESHNHNDVGSFILYRDGRPVIVDMGVGTYSRKTFSEERYDIKPMTSPYHSTAEIAGFAEPAGREYRSEDAVFAPDGTALSFELKNAYPAEAGILSYRREGRLEKGKATVSDVLRLAKEEDVVFHLISFEKPEARDGDLILGSCRLRIEPAVKPEIEEYVFEDERFVNTWQRKSVWRIHVPVRVKEGSFRFVFTPAE